MVATEESPAGEPVSLAQLQRGVDLLYEHGSVRISPETFGGYRRSSAIGAVLASLTATTVSRDPTRVSLTDETRLQEQMPRACDLMREERISTTVSTDDPLQSVVVKELAAALRDALDNDAYQVRGSVGQTTWAETPWVAAFDRLVTDSAQRGHYIVFLFHPAGEGVYLSLNQEVTEARGASGDHRARLRAQAKRMRSLCSDQTVNDLISGPINLAGRGARTRGYEVGNVAAVYFQATAIPVDAVMLAYVQRFLDLYATVTSGLDAEDAVSDPDAPAGTRGRGLESRRYRWHLRAEGRNSAVARRAKEMHGYRCQVCGRDFFQELGDLGKRCIDAHHLTPFSELDSRPRHLDPETDYAVVCSNCHRMLHSETPPLLPAELRRQL